MKTPSKENQQKFLEAQVDLMRSELEDVLASSVTCSKMTKLILEMLLELTEYVKVNGMTERAIKSKMRLVKMLDLNYQQETLSISNYQLYHTNKKMLNKYADLLAENDKFQEQLNNITKAQNF